MQGSDGKPRGRRVASARASVSLAAVVERMGLMRVAGGHVDLSSIEVTTAEVNRPGLQLTGYTEHFSSDRLQIIGWTETAYLSGLDADVRATRLDDYFALGFPALVVARGLHVMPDMVQAADRHDIPVFATDTVTSEFAGMLTWRLIHALAPDGAGGQFVEGLFNNAQALFDFPQAHQVAVVAVAALGQGNLEIKAGVQAVGLHLAQVVIHPTGS
jgi:type IV secretory pathway VirB2 component (pilin)